MTKFVSFTSASILALTLAAGCSKKASQCEQIIDHTISIMPAEFKDQVAADKPKAIEKCEKLSPEAKDCALAAKGMEDLMKCPHT